MNILIFLKFFFSLSLFITFVLFFGLPSWKKYQAKEVFINKQKISIDDISPPAVTFCALDQETTSGWKFDNMSDYEEDYSDPENLNELDLRTDILTQCNDSNSVKEVYECVDGKTFNLTETVPYPLSEITPINFADISNSSFWTNDISLVTLGKCHTLNNSVSLGTAKWIFPLDPYLDYTVVIHDPHFFLMTTNPATIPGVTLGLKASQGIQFMYIEVIQHMNMDRPQQPCAAEEDYSFTTCVKNSVAQKIGCR